MANTNGTDNKDAEEPDRRRPPWQHALVFWSPVCVPVIAEVMKWFIPQG
ncbi:hypothetical protein OG264_39550 (plasmid) [Streptomyces xanthophaeus]|nr:hypothetical protein OG264_39705 [Streptomyces xanthophaeus]WST27631.1 hypothetical protein OG264_39550 [Streptomyces xanthophaeus]WST65973.1 hypothetical protein OG605_40905 [Streptomyces xanthophaeus]WST66001.1 hypothetical protein OG605_40750 [Streptomyces xanthophaeus]